MDRWPLTVTRNWRRAALWAVIPLFAVACGDEGVGPGESFDAAMCGEGFFDGGVGRDVIPALTNPELTSPDAPDAAYVEDDDRVIGLVIDGQPIAFPFNVMWWHEVVNIDRGAARMAVTFCPLTGSSMVFDLAPHPGVEFGVSGLLFDNNLVMFRRNQPQNTTFFPQMSRQARCGPEAGTPLQMIASVEMEWGAWKSLHPNTQVLSSNTGFDRDGYVGDSNNNPYASFWLLNNPEVVTPVSVDGRRPPKERLLGIPDGDGGLALPFLDLDRERSNRVVEVEVGGRDMVVLFSTDAQAAMAFDPVLDGTRLTFEARAEGFADLETGSVWTVDGRAVEGPLAGARLQMIEEAYTAFWYAWAVFQPETDIWSVDEGII